MPSKTYRRLHISSVRQQIARYMSAAIRTASFGAELLRGDIEARSKLLSVAVTRLVTPRIRNSEVFSTGPSSVTIKSD